MTLRPEEDDQIGTLSADPPSGKGSAGRQGAYALLLLIAASIVGSRILTVPGAFSVNDQSRWLTVRALVDTGSYSIGYRLLNPDGSYRDFGIVAEAGWDTVDKVMHPTTRRLYSSKPTLLPTVAAGEYRLLRKGLHLRPVATGVS